MFTSYYKIQPDYYVERPGILPSQLAPGMHFVHRPGITMTQQENANEALDSHNGAMLHFDAKYASHTSWKRPLMVSTLTVQRLLGMASKTFARQVRIVRMSSIAMTAPVFDGDTLYAETTVIDIATQPVPGAGTLAVMLRTIGINQDGRKVATLDYEAELLSTHSSQDFFVGEPATEERFASHTQREDGAWVEQLGLYYEDLRVGESFVHSPRRTFLAEEASMHAARSLDVGAQYFDLPYALQIGLHSTAIPQSWVLAVVAALSTRLLGRVTTNLGWVDVEFGAVVEPGDTLEVRTTVLALRDSSSRPDEGIATVKTVAMNQKNQTCLSYERTLLVYRREGNSPYKAAGY